MAHYIWENRDKHTIGAGQGRGGSLRAILGAFDATRALSLFVVTAQAIYVSLIDMCASVETRDFWAFFERLSAVFNCISFLYSFLYSVMWTRNLSLNLLSRVM